MKALQGSILGPISFILFINNIIDFINYFLLNYTDDTSAEIIDTNYNEACKNTQKLLEELSMNLPKNYDMRLHISNFKNKTAFIFFNGNIQCNSFGLKHQATLKFQRLMKPQIRKTLLCNLN